MADSGSYSEIARNLIVQLGVDLAVLVVEGELLLDEGIEGGYIGDAHGGGEVLLHPGIGDFRGDSLADVVQRGAEHRRLAGQVSAAVVFGEGDVHIEGLAGGMAHDLLLKTVDEGAAAQLQVVALVAAAVKGNAVNGCPRSRY